MIEKILYGPVEFLPPVPVNQAILEISGIKASRISYTTYVFLEDVHGEDVEALIDASNYAGGFSMSEKAGTTVRLDITKALNHALKTRPNFPIVFLSRHEERDDDEHDHPVFGFENLEIIHEFPEHADFELSACVIHH
jgi:predicted transcriptional regulator